VRKSVK